MANRLALALCVFISFVVVACAPRTAKPVADEVTITGSVVDPAGRPVAGAEITLGGARVAADAKGAFTVKQKLSPERLLLGVKAPGYVAASRVLTLSTAGEIKPRPLVLRTLAKPTVLPAERGGQIRFGDGGMLVVPANAFVGADGNPAKGQVSVSVTPINVSDPAALPTAPGDFTATAADGKVVKLQSYGMFDFQASDAEGRPLSVAPGVELPFTLRLPDRPRPPPGEAIGLYRFDQAAGRWASMGAIRQTVSLVYGGVITSTGEWNADDPFETTCITIRAYSVDVQTQAQVPFPNAEVWAQGVDYASTSVGHTNANGLVCLLVKRNATVSITAYSGNWTTMTPTVLQTPNIQSGAGDCGNPDLCPLVTSIVMDLVVGMPE